MNIKNFLDIYELLSIGTAQIPDRKQMLSLRKKAFLANTAIKKVAFDTRRINQEDEANPRRGLQNYHRSDPFVSNQMLGKIKSFAKLLKVLENIKFEYGRQDEWHDSYSRVLLSSVQKALRVIEKDGDFSESQPSIAGLDYLEELMYVRYRLTALILDNTSELDIKNILLKKDDNLISNGYIRNISPSDVNKFSYDTMINKIVTNSDNTHNYDMMEKMFVNMAQLMSKVKPDLASQLFDVKATAENPNIERTVTIKIKDNLNSKEDKES